MWADLCLSYNNVFLLYLLFFFFGTTCKGTLQSMWFWDAEAAEHLGDAQEFCNERLCAEHLLNLSIWLEHVCTSQCGAAAGSGAAQHFF